MRVNYKTAPPAGSAPANGRRRGFTLVELLTVVGIIAVLVAMLVPAVGKARSYARRVACAHNLNESYLVIHMYMNENKGFYPCAEDPVSNEPFYWLWMGRGWRDIVRPYLGEWVNESNPSILYCKADPAKDKYQATSYAYSMSFYHSVEQINAMSSPADTYSNPVKSVPQKESQVEYPGGKILAGEWTSNHQPFAGDNGWWNWKGRRNFLTAAGEVRYTEAGEILPARDGFPDANLTVDGISGRDLP